ncbi:MAG TPA: GlsB/YeaQ/YmgE family stress response membrane protein [Rhizomicrobium sp.]|jgi:uncharacterized membrane protein YeaQ/YmgE (transglycosylase-associated protein family)|nr:GlsB/YeaQ/YmgE family stress response membrane protein [Rhizomicrobium sp.]
MQILGWIVFGAIVGWIANAVMGKRGGGCMVNIALGLVGALTGGVLFSALGPGFDYNQHNLLISTLVAVIGAVLVLVVWNAISRR